MKCPKCSSTSWIEECLSCAVTDRYDLIDGELIITDESRESYSNGFEARCASCGHEIDHEEFCDNVSGKTLKDVAVEKAVELLRKGAAIAAGHQGDLIREALKVLEPHV